MPHRRSWLNDTAASVQRGRTCNCPECIEEWMNHGEIVVALTDRLVACGSMGARAFRIRPVLRPVPRVDRPCADRRHVLADADQEIEGVLERATGLFDDEGLPNRSRLEDEPSVGAHELCARDGRIEG